MTDGERLENIVETAVARGDAPGVVAAVATGDETHIAAAGAMAIGGPPMRPDTVFRIASITKPVTAAVVLSLALGRGPGQFTVPGLDGLRFEVTGEAPASPEPPAMPEPTPETE